LEFTPVSIIRFGISAIGRLLILAGFAAVFLIGMVSVVYMSLKGEEVKVPDLVGKNYVDSEKELTQLGLKIHRRAERPSGEQQPNTILEQLPRPGETVKTGQQILVVVSTPGQGGEQPPSTLKKGDEDDTEKIEDMISEKPKKPKSNTNSNKKKVDTTRDINGDTTNSNTNSGSNSSVVDTGDKNKNSVTNTARPVPPMGNKITVVKPPTSGETKPRSTPKP
jgi:hypothetical protein